MGGMRQEAIFLANKMIIRIKIMRTRIIHLLENIRLFRRMHRAGTAAPAESPIQKPGGSNKQNAHLPFPSLFCIVSLYCLSYISIGNCGNEGRGGGIPKKKNVPLPLSSGGSNKQDAHLPFLY